MKLKYIDKNFVVTGSVDEMVRQGMKDIPKKAGFRFSPEGDTPCKGFAVWYTGNKAKAKKLIEYATDKARKVLERKKVKHEYLREGKRRKKGAPRKQSYEINHDAFDAECRAIGVLVRVDFPSYAAYKRAVAKERQLDPLTRRDHCDTV